MLVSDMLQIIQRGADDLVHVVVTVLAQAAAEDDVALRVGQLLVFRIQRAVRLVVDGVSTRTALLQRLLW